MDNPAEGGLGRDILNAVGANFVAYVISIIAGFAMYMVAGFVPEVTFGVFVVYCLLVAFYVHTQIRKGHKRRAVLAGWIAPIVVIVVVMNLNIA